GDFSGFQEIVGGQTVTYFRKGGVALLDATTGAIKDWNPVLQHSGNTGTYGSVLLAVNSTIYVGGGFTHAGGEGSVPATASQTRTGLAAYDASTGALTSWNPVTGGKVTAFALNGTSLFVGSSPATTGVERKHLAAIDINTGQPTDWNPAADGAVHDLALGDTTIFVAGRFKNIGGARHLKVAEVELATGRVTEWNPSANLDKFVDPPPVGFEPAPDPLVTINEIAVAGGRVLLGGKFDSPDTDLSRPALMAVSRTSGQVLNWDAGFAAGSEVRELLVDGDTVYVGGKFTAVGGQTRANLAALNIGTAGVNAWSPSVTSAGNASGAHVAALAIAGGSIYVGGDFGEIGGQAHRDLAEISLQTAQPTLWNPDVKPLTAGNPAYVESVSITGSLVYAGGSFQFLGDAERHGLAAIDRTTGLASIWNPQVSGGDVLTITTSTFGSKIFMGGSFTSALGLGADRAYLIGVRNPDPLSHNLVPKVDVRTIPGIIQSGITLEGGDGSSSVEPTTESDPLYRVELHADASDNDGQVTRVEFYNGATLLGTDTAAPFSFDWSNVAAGTYTVTARAIDNKGASTTSQPLGVTVGSAPVQPPAPTSRYTNAAAGKPTSQSSTLTGGTSSRAVDGNTSGDWSAGSVTLTGVDAEAWWEVDLGSVQAIQLINIWNRTDCCGDRLGDFYVLVSPQPFTSMNLAATLAQPGVYRYRFTGSLNAATAIPVYTQGRYVRVQLSGTNNLSLAEVEVLTRRTSRVKGQVNTLPGRKTPKGNAVAPSKK
ncbi:MAG TPA: Ig-like domain-containing protein, partial [Pyrinomonadaceae bacterium]|nr:Ig-like domain-containing protein [Pyrinomonadaceae bacterium]